MATGGEERTATGILARVPAKLAVPWADAMIIIDLAVVQFAKESLVDDRFRGKELAGEAAFEADAGFNAGLFDGFAHGPQVLDAKAKRFLDDQVFAGFRGGSDLGGMIVWVTANRDDVDVGIGEERIEIVVGFDATAMFLAQLGRVEFSG